MIEHLINLDKKLFLALNHFSVPWADPLMRFLSGPIPWVLFILGFLVVLWTTPIPEYHNRYLILIVSLILAYAISEQTSVHLFKEVFMRLRPCHEPSITGQVRLAASHCGGQYGFVSTHASNSFTLALLSALLIKRKWFTIAVIVWAVIISYSRIYVGVHYPGDVLGGAALGCTIGLTTYFISNKLLKREVVKDVTNVRT
jgi:undecaprenyl-diphosphatase